MISEQLPEVVVAPHTGTCPFCRHEKRLLANGYCSRFCKRQDQRMQYAIATIATQIVFTNIAPFVKGLTDDQAKAVSQITLAYIKNHRVPAQELGPLVRKIREALS